MIINNLVSIIIPTYNRSNLLLITLRSVQAQTFQNWEALVIDDQSVDDTEEQVRKLAQEDSRVSYKRRSSHKSGASVCRNEGIQNSQGQYLIFLDSDDCLAPHALENRVKQMQQHPELDYGVFPCVLFQDKPGDMNVLWNIDKSVDDIDRFLCLDVPWQTASPIWRKEAIAKLGLWHDELPRWQDWEYHLRALVLGLKYKKFSTPDCFWRVANPQKKAKRDAISSKPFPLSSLNTCLEVFSGLQTNLCQRKLLNDSRRNLLVGLYYWLARNWAQLGDKDEAIAVWEACYDRELLDRYFVYLQGKIYLQIFATVPAVRVLYRKLAMKNWPKEFHLAISSNLSKTLFEMPIEETALKKILQE